MDDTETYNLWSDDPSQVDLLSFDAVAKTVADALLDETLDPVALGLSGSWGKGKTTVLELVAAELGERATPENKILVIRTDPWRYDPSLGAKESLIGEVLDALATEVKALETPSDKTKKLLVRLSKRVDWAKALKLAAKTSLTMQLPDLDSLIGLVKDKEDGSDEGFKGLKEFRNEFRELIDSDDLAHIKAVAVLVDDLDRCLPETVVESLEAIKLFLSVPKMSFVIAADEDRVADAIQTRFRSTGTPEEDGSEKEDPAKLYLHKIVQTTIPLPALSHFDTQAYLLLLQLQPKISPAQFTSLIEACAQVRRTGGGIDDLEPVQGVTMDQEMAFASRLTPLLYEKLHGNPRRIKRFLNDLNVRQSIAARRGIQLDPSVVAKLMTLEALMEQEFKLLLDWFAKGEMRDKLAQLEEVAGQAVPASTSQTADESADDTDADATDSGAFSQAMIRWAKLTPPLGALDLSPYLTLAASFAGVTLIDESLPERLRDIAANLLSDSRRDQASVSDAELNGLGDGDINDLLLHIGRAIRDQPAKQKAGVNAILRIVRLRNTMAEVAKSALLMIATSDLTIVTPVQFMQTDPPEILSVLSTWEQKLPTGSVKRAVQNALRTRGRV